MSIISKYDLEAPIQETIARIHEDWRQLLEQSSEEDKALLMEIKDYYAKLCEKNPQAAVDELCAQELKLKRHKTKH